MPRWKSVPRHPLPLTSIFLRASRDPEAGPQAVSPLHVARWGRGFSLLSQGSLILCVEHWLDHSPVSGHYASREPL